MVKRSGQSRQCAEYQGAADCWDGAAPITVCPVAEACQSQSEEKRAEKGPAPGQPSLEHPEGCDAHCGYAEQDADPRAAQELSDGQNRALSGGIFGHVRGNEIYVRGLEMLPKRIRRIGQAGVGTGVGDEKVAEFIGDFRVGNGENREQAETQDYREESEYGKR